jgi:hypothetical protein
MMEPDKDRMRNNVSEPLDRACAGRVLPERNMRSSRGSRRGPQTPGVAGPDRVIEAARIGNTRLVDNVTVH